MIVCQIWGDLSSSRSSENYPMEVFCDECYRDMKEEEEKSQESVIVSVEKWDPTWGDTCYRCGKTADDEAQEKS